MLRGPIALALTLLLAPIAASAQPADPARDAEARTHFQAGRDAFSRGDFAGAATAFASFPLSLATMYGALVAIEQLALQGHLPNGLITWASGFAAGALELWLLAAIAKRMQAAAKSGGSTQP